MTDVFKLIEKHGIELHGDIEYFAELVRADERQACLKLCDKIEAEAYQMYRKNLDAYEDGVSAGARACMEEIGRRK
jgi:hypothetical protein